MGRGDASVSRLELTPVPPAPPPSWEAFITKYRQLQPNTPSEVRAPLLIDVREILPLVPGHLHGVLFCKAEYLRKGTPHELKRGGRCSACKADACGASWPTLDPLFHPEPFCDGRAVARPFDEAIQSEIEESGVLFGASDYLKYVGEGASTFAELASRLRDTAAAFEQQAVDGWTLDEPVDSGHVHMSHVDPGVWEGWDYEPYVPS